MNIILAIVTALPVFGICLFAVVAIAGRVLHLCVGYEWWATPAWVAFMFTVFVPLLAGSLVLSAYVAHFFVGWPS